MKNIIVPIDFSPCSKNALRNAIKIAQKMKMKLILCHSMVLPVGFAEGAPVGGVDYGFDELEEQAKEQLEKLVDEFPQLKEIEYKNAVQFGPVHDVIDRLTQEEGSTGLVVMGTHGASGFARALLGSNAHRVIKNVDCPVIALPETADITLMRKIALAGDYKETPSGNALQAIVDLALAFNAQIHVIHIDQEEILEHDQIEIAQRMEKYLKHVVHSFHFKRDYDVEEGLVTFAKEESMDLLAMISKHHGLIDRIARGSETKRLIMDIPMPIMILHG